MTTPGQPAPSQETVIEANSPRLRSLGGFAIVAFIGLVAATLFFSVQLAAVALVLAVGAGIVFLRRVLSAALNWRTAELVLPAPNLAMGASVQATYRRRPRAQRDVPTCNVTATLVCEEQASYRRGTERRTDVERVVEQKLTASGGGTPRGLEAPLVIEVPFDAGAPTLDLYNNEIRWYLEVVTEGPRIPSDIQHFDLVVAAALDPAVRNERGDR